VAQKIPVRAYLYCLHACTCTACTRVPVLPARVYLYCLYACTCTTCTRVPVLPVRVYLRATAAAAAKKKHGESAFLRILSTDSNVKYGESVLSIREVALRMNRSPDAPRVARRRVRVEHAHRPCLPVSMGGVPLCVCVCVCARACVRVLASRRGLLQQRRAVEAVHGTDAGAASG
jgi:hypothetical protein